MRITNLALKNMRLIGENPLRLKFSPDKNVTILLGNNGSGKSTILDSIALLISSFTSSFPSVSSSAPSDNDIHVDQHMGSYLELAATFSTLNNEIEIIRRRRGLDKAPESILKPIKDYAANLKESIIKGENVELPIFAYYGTGRGHIKAPERKRNFKKTFERWDCYVNAMTPSTDFKSFFARFDYLEDEERRKIKELRDFNYKMPALEAVRRAITSIVNISDISYTNPRIELHPLRFVMTESSGDTKRDLRIEQMSDGFKIMIAMIADIASKMTEANPQLDNPLESHGIILIDEIDLHLHPMWQREAIGQLSNIFPNIQFILTTHSPVILSGASDKAQIMCISRTEENGGSIVGETDNNINTLDIGQILLSDLFKLPSLSAPMWDEKIECRDALLAKSELSPEEKKDSRHTYQRIVCT